MADISDTSIFNDLDDNDVKETSVQTEDPTQASLGDAASAESSTPATDGEQKPSDAQGVDGSLPAPADVGPSADPTQAGAQAPQEPVSSEAPTDAGSSADAGATPASDSQDSSASSDTSGGSASPTGLGVAENPLPDEHPTPATAYNPVNPATGRPATEQELGDAPAAAIGSETQPAAQPAVDAAPAPQSQAPTDAPAAGGADVSGETPAPASDPAPAPAAPAAPTLDEAYTSLTKDGQTLFDALDKVEDDFGTIAALELQGLANHASSLRLKLEAALDQAQGPGLDDTKFGDLYAMLRGIEDEVGEYLNKAETENKESMLGDNIKSAIATLKQFAKEAYDKLKGKA